MIDEPRYAELHAHSAFTFLEGTDEPADMVAQASRLGLEALAILDVDGMYSTVQTTMAARSCGLPIVYGAEVTLDPASLRAVLPAGGGSRRARRTWGSGCRSWPPARAAMRISSA